MAAAPGEELVPALEGTGAAEQVHVQGRSCREDLTHHWLSLVWNPDRLKPRLKSPALIYRVDKSISNWPVCCGQTSVQYISQRDTVNFGKEVIAF